MELEVRLSAEEISSHIESWFPLLLDFGHDEPDDDRPRTLELSAPRAFAMVPDKGARFTCTGKLRWPIPLLSDDISLPFIDVTARMKLLHADHGAVLRVSFGVGELDVGGLPTLLDRGVGLIVHHILEARDVGFSLELGKMLTKSMGMPPMFRTVDAFSFALPEVRLSITEAGVLIRGEALLGVYRAKPSRRTAPREKEGVAINAKPTPPPVAATASRVEPAPKPGPPPPAGPELGTTP